MITQSKLKWKIHQNLPCLHLVKEFLVFIVDIFSRGSPAVFGIEMNNHAVFKSHRNCNHIQCQPQPNCPQLQTLSSSSSVQSSALWLYRRLSPTMTATTFPASSSATTYHAIPRFPRVLIETVFPFKKPSVKGSMGSSSSNPKSSSPPNASIMFPMVSSPAF